MKRTPFRSRSLTAAAALVALLAMGRAAESQAQHSTDRITCAAARGLVSRQGAIVLRTSATTYDRFVVSRAYCAATEITESAFVPTRDNRQCFVGYTCHEPRGDPY